MALFVKLFVGTAQALLFALELCMLVRAILSWFPLQEDNPILLFVAMVTEPIVAPIRALFERMGWFRNIPIDVSFFVAYILLSVVSTVIGIFA
ncbi:MAG: YggT family protein [Clostridia bacterium]|nr:YggT family protein [Clostridia bacterium]